MASYNGTDSSQCVSKEYLLELKRKVGKEWKDVGRCLGMSDAELDHIEEDNSKNVEEAIYQMLLCWKKKNGANATYAYLKDALVRSKVQMFPEDSLSRSSDKSEFLISYLKKTYAKWLRTVRPNPMKKAQKWKLEDLFMDLGIALLDQTYSSNKQDSWKSLKTFTALFEHPELNEKASKIIIEGDPGSGKTTLMYYLAYLWCNNDKIMEGVKYFILLPLRRVMPGSSIDKIIIDVLLRASGGRLTQTDMQCILRNESCMILALDGLDEYPGLQKEEYQDTGVMSIIRAESEFVSPEVKVILTTRPSGLPHIHDCDVKRVRLERLQDIHRDIYLKKVFPREEDEIKRRLILEAIDANYFIQDYCELPLWFTLIVHIMRDDLQTNKEIKLTCLTDFFKYILRGLRGHLVNKKKPDLEDLESPKLAEIAFNGLLHGSLNQIWNKKDLVAVENYEKLVEIGILVEEEDFDSDFMYSDARMAPKTVTFLHKTFQEWYGAKYLADLSKAAAANIFTQKLKQSMNFFNLNLFCFTCGNSPEATRKILDYYLLGEDKNFYNCDIFFRFILEYNGKECDLKKYIEELCQVEETSEQPTIFTLSKNYDTLLLRSKVLVLRLAYEFQITVKHVDLQLDELTYSDLGQIKTRRNIDIPPLSCKVLTVHKHFGQPLFSFLKECCNLEELRLDTDIFPGTPEEIRKFSLGKEVKVVWLIKKPYPGVFQQMYEMIDNEWQCITGRYCGYCDEPIKGLFWECRSCVKFYLCDICKTEGCHASQSHQLDRKHQSIVTGRVCGHCDNAITEFFWECKSCSKFCLCGFCKEKGCHANHSLRLGREFDDREVTKCLVDNTDPPPLPFVKILERERHKIVCSGCKEADVTADGFECETCVNFYFCELCKDKVPQKHKLKERNYHGLKGCFYCIGRTYGCARGKKYKVYSLCEKCWHSSVQSYSPWQYRDPRRLLDMTSDVRTVLPFLPPRAWLPRTHQEFESRRCKNCQIGGEGNEVWFRCDTCPEFLLCERCKDEGIHAEHKFNRQFYPEVLCENCRIPVISIYRCKTCQGRFLCLVCQIECNRRQHEVEEVKEAELMFTVSDQWIISTLLPGIPRIHKEFKLRCCENCKVGGEINQVWFRCDTCPYFLLCGKCKDKGIHEEHKFNRQYYPDVNCENCGIPVVLIYRCKTCQGRILCIICQVKCDRMKHEIEEIKETEINHGDIKCSHGHHHIFGTRYKCTSCTHGYNICKSCKSEGAHSEPHIFKEERIEYTEDCSHCKKGITGLSFKCKRCPIFRLCEDCNSKGIHREHKFREIRVKEVHNIGVKCKECFGDVYGSRFRCTTCSGYEMCQECMCAGKHSEHKLMEIKQAELYHNIQCDRCHAGIHDIRFKCKKCRKYNVCKHCVTEDISKGHNYVKIPVYDTSKCSRCQWRIFGHGFCCKSCILYSICESCKLVVTDDNTCKHEFVEFRMKEVQHKYIHCNLCKEYQFQGTRYRCKTCKWYNLCEFCKRSEHHGHHAFEEWKTSQFLPGPSELPYMY